MGALLLYFFYFFLLLLNLDCYLNLLSSQIILFLKYACANNLETAPGYFKSEHSKL